MWSGPYCGLYCHAVCTWKLWKVDRLNLINQRVVKITATHAVYTWRCWTLPFLWSERERMQLVYEFILLSKILRSHPLSEHMQWNYASFKNNRLTSISSNKIIKLPIEILLIRPLIACHSPHISRTITSFCVIEWHLWLSTTEGEISNVGSITLLAELSFRQLFTLYESFVWQTLASLELFTWLVYLRTYCVRIATLNQNKRSRLLYLGDALIKSH